MSRKHIAGLVASSLVWASSSVTPLAAQTRSTTPVPGEFKVFRDWAVACDNIKSCGGAGLMAETEISNFDAWLTLDLERKAGPTAPATIIATFGEDWKKEFPSPSSVRFSTGGGVSLPFRLHGEHGQASQSWRLTLSPDVVEKLHNATVIQMHDSSNKVLAMGSVQGLNASMRYIDDIQGRTGSVTALMARGPKSANRVPAAPAAPFIRTAPRSMAAPAGVTVAQIKNMEKRAGCDVPVPSDSQRGIQRTRLDATSTLIAVPCGSGAYNVLTAYYIVRPGKPPVPAPFDYDADWGESDVPTLVNSNFEPAKQRLNHFAKGRGIGDCGTAASWVWDGGRFRLIEKTEMDSCRSSMNWLRTWTAISGPAARR